MMTVHTPRVLIACICLCAAGVAQAAEYRSAVGAYKAKDYPACARLYGQQADRTPPVRGAAYDAACCQALAGDKEAAAAALKAAQPEMARGVARGVLHKNTVARKMSRLTRRVATL